MRAVPFPFLLLFPCVFLSFPFPSPLRGQGARCKVRGASCAFSFSFLFLSLALSFPFLSFPFLSFPFLFFLFLWPLHDELEVALPTARNLAAAMCQGTAEPQPALQPQLCERLLRRAPIPQNVFHILEVKAQKQLRIASRELGMEALDPLPAVRASLGHERRRPMRRVMSYQEPQDDQADTGLVLWQKHCPSRRDGWSEVRGANRPRPRAALIPSLPHRVDDRVDLRCCAASDPLHHRVLAHELTVEQGL